MSRLGAMRAMMVLGAIAGTGGGHVDCPGVGADLPRLPADLPRLPADLPPPHDPYDYWMRHGRRFGPTDEERIAAAQAKRARRAAKRRGER